MVNTVVLDAYEKTGLHLVVDNSGLYYVVSKDQRACSLLNIVIVTKILYGNPLYAISYREFKWLTSDYVNSLVTSPLVQIKKS